MLDRIGEIIQDQWPGILGAAATFFAGRWWGRWRAHREFSSREFRGRLNFSLNEFDGTQLRIRTLRECNIEDVFFNRAMSGRLREVADATTPEDPILPFSDEERWHFQNVVLNEVSELSAGSLLHADAGGTHKRTPYVLCITNEKDGDMRTWKIRVMVVRKEALEGILAMGEREEEPTFESGHHGTRWRTLVTLARRYAAKPKHFLTMEIVT